MRGLSVFISDIRNCQNKEQERLRVDKELANIRTHFKAERKLTPYEKKKYVWKLLYIFMLGYDVDFGHMEAVSLISAPKYAEKQVLSPLSPLSPLPPIFTPKFAEKKDCSPLLPRAHLLIHLRLSACCLLLAACCLLLAACCLLLAACCLLPGVRPPADSLG
ncbi:unnamed protein product [Closterium sp. NIES-53]